MFQRPDKPSEGRSFDLPTFEELRAACVVNSVNSDNSGPEPNSTRRVTSLRPRLDPAALYGLAGRYVNITAPYTEASKPAILFQLLSAAGHSFGRSPFYKLGQGADQHCVLYVLVIAPTGQGKGTSWGIVRDLFLRSDPQFNEATGLSSREGLAHAVDGEGAQRALLVHEPEFASLLAVARREGNPITTGIRDLWDRDWIQVMTKNNPVKVTGMHLALIGHITPSDLESSWSSNDTQNGFGSRFLMVHSRRPRIVRWPEAPPELTIAPLGEELKQAIAVARNRLQIRCDSGAKDLYEASIQSLVTHGESAVDALIARARAHVLRMAMVYALLDQSEVIRAPHLAASLAAWDYSRQSIEYYFGFSLSKDAKRILGIVRARIRIDKTTLYGECGNSWRADRLDAAIEELEGTGQVRVVKEHQTGGRPREWVELVNEPLEDAEETELTEESPPGGSV